tara:strand:+ start:416 stop:1012 length:597 start_codon:yes stop_codon:yes gene_type:complete
MKYRVIGEWSDRVILKEINGEERKSEVFYFEEDADWQYNQPEFDKFGNQIDPCCDCISHKVFRFFVGDDHRDSFYFEMIAKDCCSDTAFGEVMQNDFIDEMSEVVNKEIIAWRKKEHERMVDYAKTAPELYFELMEKCKECDPKLYSFATSTGFWPKEKPYKIEGPWTIEEEYEDDDGIMRVSKIEEPRRLVLEENDE